MAGFVSNRISSNFKLVKGELQALNERGQQWIDNPDESHVVLNQWLDDADEAVSEGKELPSRPELTGLAGEVLQLLWPE